MYDEISLPTGGSPAAKQATPHAFDLTERFDVTVHVSSVVNTTRGNAGVVGGIVFDTLGWEGRRIVDEVEAYGEHRGIETHGVVRRDVPHDAVLDYTTEHSVEAVMTATHGRTDVKRVLLGSVTERVIRAASVPVLTVRAAEQSGCRGEATTTT